MAVHAADRNRGPDRVFRSCRLQVKQMQQTTFTSGKTGGAGVENTEMLCGRIRQLDSFRCIMWNGSAEIVQSDFTSSQCDIREIEPCESPSQTAELFSAFFRQFRSLVSSRPHTASEEKVTHSSFICSFMRRFTAPLYLTASTFLVI